MLANIDIFMKLEHSLFYSILFFSFSLSKLSSICFTVLYKVKIWDSYCDIKIFYFQHKTRIKKNSQKNVLHKYASLISDVVNSDKCINKRQKEKLK